MLKLYNTLTRKVEEFKSLGEEVKVYTCGPTVYNFPHIGNYAAYTYWDLLVRTLKADGYKVKRVLNLTDVGHLVSDADEYQPAGMDVSVIVYVPYESSGVHSV